MLDLALVRRLTDCAARAQAIGTVHDGRAGREDAGAAARQDVPLAQSA